MVLNYDDILYKMIEGELHIEPMNGDSFYTARGHFFPCIFH